MSNDIQSPNNSRNGKALAGIILLAVGGYLLLKQFSIYIFPPEIVLWPCWLIFWGLFIAARSNFQKPTSFILVVIGIVLLIDKNLAGSGNVIWPLAIIAFGVWLILRRHNKVDHEYWEKRYGHKWDWRNPNPAQGQNPNEPVVDYTTTDVPPNTSYTRPPTGDDYLDAVSIFGGVKKTILSKDFKGGEIVNIFGGAELDFSMAEINGRVIIDVTQVFGGTKIIVPSHWQVVSDMAAVFAGLDDKRMKSTAALNSEKILVLKGVSIFAGIDIRSYY